MNILVCASSDSSFNSIRPEGEIYIALAKRGHHVVIVTHDGTSYAARYREHGIEVIDGHPRKRFDRNYLRILRNAMSDMAFDVVYATNSKTIRHAVRACRGFPVALVTYRGTTGGLYWHDPTAWLSHFHPRVNGIICVSAAVRDDVRRQFWWSRRRAELVVAIHKGHSLEWYDLPPVDLSGLGIAADAFVVTCVVNARPSKGVEVLLRASHHMAENPHIHLVLVGKGMDQAPYGRLIAASPMRERIHVLGYRFDAPQIIAAADLLVQPSISGEGLPRAVMEAMGSGTPVVATSVGGAKEAITEGVEGFIIPPGQADVMAARVLQLASDPRLRRNMAAASKAAIAGPMSSLATVEATEAFFQRVVAQIKEY